jgi:DNA-3-methyladenine glycosylase
MFEPLPRSFYRPSAKAVAPRLLGHLLVRRAPEGLCGGIIVETEAYLHNDPACHAFRGPTARNRSMFGPGGHAYVYFIYGNHYCFNAVCGPAGVGEAVLVRALDPWLGLPILQANRPVAPARGLTNGPAKVCQAMAIDRRLDGVDLCCAASPVFVARNPQRAAYLQRCGRVARSPRIGITQAAERLLRFYLAGHPAVSRAFAGQSRCLTV